MADHPPTTPAPGVQVSGAKGSPPSLAGAQERLGGVNGRMCSVDSPVEKEGAVGCLLPLNELQCLLRRRMTVIPTRDHPTPWPGAHPAPSSPPETTPLPSPEPTQPCRPAQDHTLPGPEPARHWQPSPADRSG